MVKRFFFHTKIGSLLETHNPSSEQNTPFFYNIDHAHIPDFSVFIIVVMELTDIIALPTRLKLHYGFVL